MRSFAACVYAPFTILEFRFRPRVALCPLLADSHGFADFRPAPCEEHFHPLQHRSLRHQGSQAIGERAASLFFLRGSGRAFNSKKAEAQYAKCAKGAREDQGDKDRRGYCARGVRSASASRILGGFWKAVDRASRKDRGKVGSFEM